MSEPNLLIIMDDEHSANALGCYGHPIAQTPNLDRLATGGTRFESAYTNCPICVPARATLATGLYPHQTGYWDNCLAYDGEVPSWGHALQEAGVETTSIGKLHYLELEGQTGFDRQHLPMYLHGGGDTHGLVRDNPPMRPQCADLATKIGPGESEYLAYDRRIRDKACDWLEKKADEPNAKPWVTFVSFISPHYPLIAPKEFYDLYDPSKIPLPKKRADDTTGDSEWWQAFENCYIWDRFFESDDQRRIAIASYYGLISFIDDCVGQILGTLKKTGLEDSTRVVFFSDHGENLGARGLWGKSTMYNESVAVPMIVSGPGIPAGKVSTTPVSLVDVHPTALQIAGLPADPSRPGRSLVELAQLPDDDARIVFSEYHATAAKSGEFMLRRGRYKYIHYVGYAPELYDLRDDPEELTNLALSGDYDGLVREFEALLRALVDPEAVDARAKADQAVLIEKYGGREVVASKTVPSATPAPKVGAMA
ncbi:sulfatase-like hydrolase/transferase [Mesorhizobium sp. Cs1299R1N3]|uniref:sulfatase-like hydrolase/transferase n=1 Tax=Mesorhizobium sp. Cs1299R1N3 TaxID=3015173 RepID=UPI00301BA986